LRPLKELSVKERGWTLDVLRVVQSLGKQEFKTSDMYEYVRHCTRSLPLGSPYRLPALSTKGLGCVSPLPAARLQVLRDRGFLRQHERGAWMVT
jgi:type II restriction enzyme